LERRIPQDLPPETARWLRSEVPECGRFAWTYSKPRTDTDPQKPDRRDPNPDKALDKCRLRFILLTAVVR
jgi:hypothetical protein